MKKLNCVVQPLQLLFYFLIFYLCTFWHNSQTFDNFLTCPHPKPIPPLICSSSGVINLLQYSLVCPLHDAMSKVQKYSVYGGCTTDGARRPASPPLGPAHCHTATVAHIVALTPRLKEQGCRAQNEDVLEALDRLSSPM